jgi:hypothetical protein
MNQKITIGLSMRVMKSIFKSALLTAGILLASPAVAEPDQLKDYLKLMDRTEVRFSGRIKYNRLDSEFIFFDDNREIFYVTVDAGRNARERIEIECVQPLMVSYSDLCTITGTGTIEIRGSRIYISIETIEQLGQ